MTEASEAVDKLQDEMVVLRAKVIRRGDRLFVQFEYQEAVAEENRQLTRQMKGTPK